MGWKGDEEGKRNPNSQSRINTCILKKINKSSI
jgi:hypothetical protein